MSIIDLYSAESWSISTVLCVLSGIDETDSSSAIVWNCCCWALRHGDCPVASSRLSDLQQRRSDDQKGWAGNLCKPSVVCTHLKDRMGCNIERLSLDDMIMILDRMTRFAWQLVDISYHHIVSRCIEWITVVDFTSKGKGKWIYIVPLL